MYPLFLEQPSYAIAFWLAYAAWAVLELTVMLFTRRAGARARGRDRGSFFAVLLGIWGGLGLSFWLAFALPGAAILWARPLVFWLGIALMLVGVALRWYAVRVLGRYFTRIVTVQEQQPVVQSGPYRYIRHPAYSGSLLTFLGIGLALGNWASLLAFMACTLSAFGYRIAVEERMLRDSLGQPYVDYMKRTRRLVPFVF